MCVKERERIKKSYQVVQVRGRHSDCNLCKQGPWRYAGVQFMAPYGKAQIEKISPLNVFGKIQTANFTPYLKTQAYAVRVQ